MVLSRRPDEVVRSSQYRIDDALSVNPLCVKEVPGGQRSHCRMGWHHCQMASLNPIAVIREEGISGATPLAGRPGGALALAESTEKVGEDKYGDTNAEKP